MEREAFVERLRLRLAPDAAAPAPDVAGAADAPLASAGKPAASAPAPAAPAPAAPVESLSSAPDPTALFVERLAGLGVTVAQVASLAQAQEGVERLIAERGWGAVACAADLCWDGVAARHTLEAREAPFGLSRADWAVAETGSVVVCSSAMVRRGYSLVPPAAGFFVTKRCIVPTIGDVLRALPGAGPALPSCVSFISGPSSTSDLAAIHVVGVHGPGEVFVWVIAGDYAEGRAEE